MTSFMDRAGTIIGSLGVLICLLSALARVAGQHHLIAFELATLFLGGTALIATACLAKLQVLVARLR